MIRRFESADADFILNLVNTPGWLNNIGDKNIQTHGQALAYLENGPLKSYSINGFGLYLVMLKDTCTSIGMCGFIKREELPFPDLGFAFLPEHVGHGFAEESARKLLENATDDLNSKTLLAITKPENKRSSTLLSKLGFLKTGNHFPPALPREILDLYQLAL